MKETKRIARGGVAQSKRPIITVYRTPPLRVIWRQRLFSSLSGRALDRVTSLKDGAR
ncbi:MAG: hypothetical protein MOB07_13130 [Acidobacteria bacterium]|nr:hypothetical protein [Acidobacteriota bacterium]